jgi:hypothetical protein
MVMNSGQDASPDLPNPEVSESGADADLDSGAIDPDIDIDPDVDTESLQRSRDAIDQGREAAREALKDETDVAVDPEG